MQDNLTIFELDVERQAEFYLTTAILLSNPHTLELLKAIATNTIGDVQFPIEPAQIQQWAVQARNTANELIAETEKGGLFDENRIVL